MHKQKGKIKAQELSLEVLGTSGLISLNRNNSVTHLGSTAECGCIGSQSPAVVTQKVELTKSFLHPY